MHVLRVSVHSRSTMWPWCPALTKSSRPQGQTSTWAKLKPGRWTASLHLVPSLTFILKFAKDVFGVLICAAHCCLQERFRKCSRRRTCLWATWNQRHLLQCEFCSSLFFALLIEASTWAGAPLISCMTSYLIDLTPDFICIPTLEQV